MMLRRSKCGPRVCASDDPLHSWRGRSTLMWSIEEALSEFLGAPSAGTCLNELVVIGVCGAAGAKARDRALYDAVAGRHDAPCETFEQAFRACCVAYDGFGHRDWRDLDLASLHACCDEYRALRLPGWVEAAIIEAEIAAYHEAAVDEVSSRREIS